MKLDGSTENRQDLIDDFNDDPSIKVFLLTSRAAGVGINLSAANVVVTYDLDINPHVDQQCEDRAWRLGQKRDVRVYRLICKNTVEDLFIMKKRELKTEIAKQMEQKINV